jgi:hypothetical protein
MGGTAALIMALGLQPHLRTALISSGVTFAGYQALTDWYIPHPLGRLFDGLRFGFVGVRAF